MSAADVALTLALLLAASSVCAQSADPREEARDHFMVGMVHVQRARMHDAIREFEQARRLAPTPATLFNLGVAQRAVGWNRAAIASFREYLLLGGLNLTPERHAQVEHDVNELVASLAHVIFQVDPANAVTLLDGEPPDTPGVEAEVDPGRHIVSAQAPGYEPASQGLTLAPGERRVVALRLRPTQTLGHLRVLGSVPGAAISVDGRVVGHVQAELDLQPGRHVLRVEAPGHSAYNDTVQITVGETLGVTPRLVRETSIFRSPWFWTGVGVVVVGLTVGGVLLFSGTDSPPPFGSMGSEWGTISTGR